MKPTTRLMFSLFIAVALIPSLTIQYAESKSVTTAVPGDYPSIQARVCILTSASKVQPAAAPLAVNWWPMRGHDLNHTGYSTSTAPNTNNTVWSLTTGNWVTSSPAVADGRVFVGSKDCKVYCLNASTGAHVWDYTTGGEVYSSPAVADGKVYVGSADAKVYAFSEERALVVPDQYSTIQEAVNNAVDDDSIFVKAGTYYEHVVVNKTLTLVGEDVTTTIIDGNETGRVIDVVSDNVILTGFTVQRGQFGIYVQNSRYTNIFNNIITHNYGGEWDAGIRLDSAGYTEIFSNNIADNGYGISFTSSSSNNVSGNNIAANNFDGFYLSDSNSNTVSGNNIANNVIGINLDYSSSNTVYGNNIANCVYGLYIYSSSNTVYGNNMTNNSYGIYLHSSSTNLIYHNNFVNIGQVYLSTPQAHVWDDGYPSGGNYWSDYTGLDQYSGPYQNLTGSDRIGDNPYVIDAANKDNYPLMTPWTPQALSTDINDDGIVNILDITIVAKAFGSKQGESAYNEAADLDKNGQVNIIDISRVAKDYGETI